MKANKKQQFKAGLSIGVFAAIFFILQNLITEDNFSIIQIAKLIILGLCTGALSGIIFSWLIGLFNNSGLVKSTAKIITEPDEFIVFETPANHFKGVEAVGGKLYLTNKRLFFKSHKFNIQNHKLSISLNEIMFVNKYKSLGLVNNGLSVGIKGGLIEKFVVNEIEEWIKHLSGKEAFLQQSIHVQS